MLILTEMQREALLLRSRGLTSSEIAKLRNRSSSAVETQFYKALKANKGHTAHSLLAEFVREQCQQGIWE